jgi:rare lipoprotein A
MKAGRNRPGRKDQLRRERTTAERLRRRIPWIGLLSIAAVIALATAPAEAGMGGASTGASSIARTGGAIAFNPLRRAGATWYGPGLYGNQTACGQVLRPGTIGVAHRDLPCGTPVKFVYRGHYLVTRVIDRGPYTEGNEWDLTNGARKILGFNTSDQVRYAVARAFARR